jgi:amidophosphoribosyltransferase
MEISSITGNYSDCDAELILNELAAQLAQQGEFSVDNLFHAVSETFDAVQGSYSVVSVSGKNGMLAFRDPHGFKPLIFGKSANSHAFASESVALDVLEYDVIDDVSPGEAIFVDHHGTAHRRILKKAIHTPCIFEWIYFARPDSIIDTISVYEARYELGKRLAADVAASAIKPDVVIPIPDTSRTAALALADELHVPYREGLIKNRYIGRTFIMARQTERKIAVRMKLNPIRGVIEGKKVLLVDDSIVRGNTSKEIINLVRASGAKEIYFAAYSPPLRYPCIYGIDMQTKADFIAKGKTVDAIRKDIGADKLLYQSMDGLLGSMQLGAKKEFRFFCTSCFDGNYPTKVDEKVFTEIEKDRIASKTTIQ